MNGQGIDFTRRDRKRARQRINAEKAQVRILRGLTKEMPPIQAIVFMSYFNQFPERWDHRDKEYYFLPDPWPTIRQLGIKPRVFRKLTRNLVDQGWLKKRSRGLRGPAQYRVMFERLDKYAASGTTSL